MGPRRCRWEKLKPVHEIYDYDCKYTAGMATEEFRRRFPLSGQPWWQQQAVAAFKSLKLVAMHGLIFGCHIREREWGEFLLSRANTLPVMTELSLIPGCRPRPDLVSVAVLKRSSALRG